MTSPVPLDGRLYDAAERLLLAFAQGSETPPAGRRGVVQEQDAVDAAVMLFASIYEQVQASRIRPEVGTRMAALLMLVRDFVRPLPASIAAGGPDLLTADLAEMTEVVRLSRISRNTPARADEHGVVTADKLG